MKRRIEVNAGNIRITATINSNGEHLTRDEVERVRDELADRLQAAAAALPYMGVSRNRVSVR